MSRLIHVGTNELSTKKYNKFVENVEDSFLEKYPDGFTNNFQSIPLEILDKNIQEYVKEQLIQDIERYAYNYLSPDGDGPILMLSGMGDVRLIRQSAKNEKFDEPILEYESNNMRHLASAITIIWHLNEIKVNGELEFVFQEVQIRPSNKEVVIFPSYYTHSHKFNPSDKEKLFLITTFYIGG